MEAAADAFEELAARHQQESNRAGCRILILALIAGIVTTIVIVLVVDASRTSASRRYASAIAWEQKAGDHCDAALGRRRLWFGNVVSASDHCVSHYSNKSVVRAFDDASLSFLVIGDWGRDGMCCQRDVAAEMSIAAERLNPKFVVSVGDNFYERGIPYPNDTQVKRSWRDVYINPHPSMHEIPWKVILGNHDYGSSARAQVQLTNVDNLWHMPDSYFFETSDDGKVFMAFLDTTAMYYTEAELQANFTGDVTTPAYREKQLNELKKALTDTTAPWKIVFGHHPLFASSEHGTDEPENIKRLQAIIMNILKNHRVDAYFSGHEHTLEHHESGGIHFFVSGAGSKTRPLELNLRELRFALARQGFMAVTIKGQSKELNVQVVDMEGKVLHVADMRKG